MNKKILKTVKVILWGLVYMLPIIHFLLVVKDNPTLNFYTTMTLYVARDNFLAKTITQVFGVGSQVPIFSNENGVIQYLAYFVYISFAHICVDVVLFLPDCARYIFDKMTGAKDEDSI